MSSDLKKYFCPRLIDFVIIVGCKEPATPSQLLAKHLNQLQQQQQHYLNQNTEYYSPEARQKFILNSNASNSANRTQLTQLPDLLRRYPLDDHNDFMLPQDVIYFCQPEGCTNINCSNQQRANSNRDTTSFIFTLTEKDSARVRYGVCINFFRPIEKKYDRQTKKQKCSDQTAQVDTDEEVVSTNKSEDNANKKSFMKKRNKKASEVKYTHTLTSLCIISHHPFFSLFRECLNILRRIIEACHARSLASKPSTPSSINNPIMNAGNDAFKSQRDTVWGILTGSSGTLSTEQISSLVACEIKEIETWILRLLSAPVPVPGKTKLIVN